ncbi:MAG: hypothetical protein WBA93_23605, partial [Microcoleaceae cyanobacterium]
YLPQAGYVYLPKKDERYNPVEEKTEENIDLIKQANELGLGSPSTLKRLSEETLKERIENKLKESN